MTTEHEYRQRGRAILERIGDRQRAAKALGDVSHETDSRKYWAIQEQITELWSAYSDLADEATAAGFPGAIDTELRLSVGGNHGTQ